MLSMADWSEGIEYEIRFWSNWMETKGAEWPEDFIERQSYGRPFSQYLRSLISERSHLKVLDVGAGPLTTLGTQFPDAEIELRACDPLATIYNELLDRHGIDPPVRTEFALAEELSAFFPLNHFDLVHCQNALDHSADPLRGIQQMVKVCSEGGFVQLSHHRNEAEREAYAGFHQHNFDVESGRFVIWNKASRTYLDEALDRGQAIDAWVTGEMVVVSIKKGPVAEGEVTVDEYRERLKLVCKGFVDGLCQTKARGLEAKASRLGS